uniref:F-box domain-containing protein n=1 Tax=Panagrellus redivivus TaxID=6233 RepID=A0A7E4VVW5_PANRE
MAQLKHHLIQEMATDLCAREEAKKRRGVFVTALSSVEKFILAGKEPFHIFRRIVGNDVTITSVASDSVEMTYRKNWPIWKLESVFLNSLFLKWARKLHGFCRCLNTSPRTGYSKILAENSDLEELCESDRHMNDWNRILPWFPNLVVLRVHAIEFVRILNWTSTLLPFLRKVVLIDYRLNRDVLSVHKYLAVHQNRCPNLETIQYNATKLEQMRFPARFRQRNVISSVKHIKITDHVEGCCTPLNFFFLTAAQKTFPSLESVEIEARADCQSLEYLNMTQKGRLVDYFYKAFESLNFGFTIKITFRECVDLFETPVSDLFQYFTTKGKVYGTPKKFTVRTSFPGKELIYEVISR